LGEEVYYINNNENTTDSHSSLVTERSPVSVNKPALYEAYRPVIYKKSFIGEDMFGRKVSGESSLKH